MSERKLVKYAQQLSDYGLEIANTVVSGLGFALIGIFYEINKKWKHFGVEYDSQDVGLLLLFIVTGCSIIIGIRIIKKTKSLSLLEDDKKELSEKVQSLENTVEELYADFFKLFNDQLAIIFHRLDYTANERISVYRHEKDSFILLGRYSLHSKYNLARRKKYPDHEGFIAKVWESEAGELHVEDCPLIGKKLKVQKTAAEFANMPISTLHDIRMKSRCFYLKCITDSADLNRKAIIVFESLHAKHFDVDKILEILGEEDKRLTLLIEKIKTNSKDSSLAENSGF